MAPVATKTSRRDGTVKGQPRRFISGHNSRTPGVPLCGYVIDDATGCWVWGLALDNDGYGRAQVGPVKRLAHRVEYERRVGPIPPGLVIDHLCRNRACVNPDHLEPVAQVVNIRRGLRTRLTVGDVLAIRSDERPAPVVAAEYGVSDVHVGYIRSRKSWGDVA
jgi:hypothetical protein